MSHALRFSTVLLGISAFCWSFLATAAGFPVVVEAERQAVLSAERAGVVAGKIAAEGKRIKGGAALLSLDTEELQLELKRRKHSATYLRARYNTLADLNRDGLAPDDEVAEVRMQRDINQAEIQLLELRIARSVVKAPFTGRVSAHMIRPHEWVTQGQPLIAIVDPDTLRIAANLPASHVANLSEGQGGSISVPALGGVSVEVKLQAVVPSVEVQSDTVRTLWQVKSPPDDLLPGMKATLSYP